MAEWFRLDVPADSAQYVEACLQPRFPERDEPRNLRAMGGFSEIVEASRTGGRAGSQRAAAELLVRPEYADHDVLYMWMLDDEHDPHGALETLREGLERCPRKRFLLDRLGLVMLRLDHGPEALYYWAQATGCAVRAGDADGFSSYLYLANVARVLRAWRAGPRLARKANPEGAGPPLELEPELTYLIDRVFGAQRNRRMKAVVKALA
ncbi:hypothetical protein AB0M54_16380 [Actinoplanes sp. NPDC051470]|uniref:hypothetical protein n=1 Tax=Actinoplanes sp. NPDC051470 TaxID=3157224 RepID=UPI00343528B4